MPTLIQMQQHIAWDLTSPSNVSASSEMLTIAVVCEEAEVGHANHLMKLAREVQIHQLARLCIGWSLYSIPP